MHFRANIAFKVRRFFQLSSILLLLTNLSFSQQAEPDEPVVSEVSSRTQSGARFVPGRVLVIFDPAIDDNDGERIISSRGGRSISRDSRLGLSVVELPAGADEEAAVRAFRNQPGVVAAELDEIVPPSQITPNDPYFSSQTHLKTINAPAAWVKTTGTPSVIVAVIDTGVSPTHADLAGRLLPGWNTYDNTARKWRAR